MYSYSNRRQPPTHFNEPQKIESQPVHFPTQMYYRRQYENPYRNTTPNKERRIRFANKENNSINILPQSEDYVKKQLYQENSSVSPLKKQSGLCEMNIVQRSTRKPLGFSRNAFNEEFSQQNYDPTTYATPRLEPEEYKSGRNASERKSYRGRDPTPQKERQSSRYYNRRQEKNYSYLRDKDKEFQQNKKSRYGESEESMTTTEKQQTSRNYDYNESKRCLPNKKKEIEVDIDALEPKSPLRTPRKTRPSLNLVSNPYIQKTEMLRQRIQKIGKMTPKGSIYKNIPKEPEIQQNYQNQPVRYPQKERLPIKQSQCRYSSRQEKRQEIQPERYYQKYESEVQQYERYKPDNELTGIQNLSRKINERLKAIISKHQN